MIEIFWGCFVFGVLFTLVTVVFGDIIGSFMDGVFDFLSVDGLDFLEPVTIVGGLTIFGGSGILLTQYTSLHMTVIIILSICAAILMSILVYFLYVKPMKNAENSISHSIQDYVGKIGEVTVTIPQKGYGEVLIKIGASQINEIASSYDGEVINEGTKVVVIEVKDSTLYVSSFDS
ncbi:NfeD family protein [Chengkuizengella axinellae]|uniref:NfeD family protein n=1 Tax=Chengkuizengella axinellae TaxID=3064388 RepID=A0ABT9J061_9BACL|nr:NfeD family protein [Chengkuizengella sp. 2205SS18-9]MDP5275003.1 NfeD family protein [Chengkuizengella sp. 2205SS18-9]